MAIDHSRLGTRITALREKNGLSLEALAKRAEIDIEELQAIEAGGDISHRVFYLYAISRALAIPPTDLFLVADVKNDGASISLKPDELRSSLSQTLRRIVEHDEAQHGQVPQPLLIALVDLQRREGMRDDEATWQAVYAALKKAF
jgi:transcriptional regulator with XRE-family HTH domain